MYSFGSVSAVGSWFFISLTSNVRKSLALMLAEDELLSDELSLDPLVAVVPVVCAVPEASAALFLAAVGRAGAAAEVIMDWSREGMCIVNLSALRVEIDIGEPQR